ncbi:MAG TPA: sensor histidine kinase [Thermoleophilaceae bacterium]|nr:sensor histidine kinase [Thermoleophilaceae bacterium]
MSRAKLAHQAFLYDGAEQFAATMAPLVRAGIERGDKVVVAAKRESADALRTELGTDGGDVELHDTLEWHPHPADRLTAVQQTVAQLAPGRSLLALGEPIWHGSEATRREWARYESTLNVALVDAPLRFICLYDRSELPEGILRHGRGAHPELVEDGGVCPCTTFERPADCVRELDAAGAVPPPPDRYDIPFRGDQHSFRGALRGLALECGMGADRAEELVLASNEVVANAVVHGDPPVTTRCWVADGDFVCEVCDGGPGVPDPFAGWTLPEPGSRSGWGLALTRRICDALELTAGADESCVRLYLTLDQRLAVAA